MDARAWRDDRGSAGQVATAVIGGVFAVLAAAVPFLLARGDGDTGAPPAVTPSLPDPAPGAAAEVFLSETSAPGGSEIRVSGEGFQAGERVVLRVHTEQVGSTQVSSEGAFANVAITVPESLSIFAPQQFSVVATGQDSIRTATAPLTVSG